MIACQSPQVLAALKKVLPLLHVTSIFSAGSASKARTLLSENEFDIAIIACPLPDEFGKRFAREAQSKNFCEVLLLVPTDRFDETFDSVMEQGILVVSLPTSGQTLLSTLRTLCTMRERIRGMQKKQASLEDKMAEIRLVNHAKWLLIDHLSMAEDDAQRYIEKQAMNLRIPKAQLAREIIKQYE